MNAAIRSVVRTCAYMDVECSAIYRGYQGMIEGDFVPFNARSVNNIINKGGTILKTARCDEFRTPEGRKIAHDQLVKAGIDGFVVIGGDGSFRGASIFHKEFDFPVIGIPGTIDNDIFGTQYTLGFDTALNTVVEAIDKIRDTASSHSRLFFVEVMGRDVGHIALNAGVAAGAEEILIPEQNLGLERLLDSLKRSKKSGKSSSIVVVGSTTWAHAAVSVRKLSTTTIPTGRTEKRIRKVNARPRDVRKIVLLPPPRSKAFRPRGGSPRRGAERRNAPAWIDSLRGGC